MELDSVFKDNLSQGLTYINGSFTVNGTVETPTINGQEISYALTLVPNTVTMICFKVLVK